MAPGGQRQMKLLKSGVLEGQGGAPYDQAWDVKGAEGLWRSGLNGNPARTSPP